MRNEISKRPATRFRCLALVAVLTLICASPMQAANTCPWMNEATASGLLGGVAVGAYQPATQETPATCTFTQHAGQIIRILRVQVEIVKSSARQLELREKICGGDMAPLPAIGNQAVFCSAKASRSGLTELGMGRIRDQVFVIEIGTTAKSDASLNFGALQSAIHVAAEQIAGNLY